MNISPNSLSFFSPTPWPKAAKALSAGFRGKRAEWQAGRFIHPHDACIDKNGNIYTVEWVVGGRVTKLMKV